MENRTAVSDSYVRHQDRIGNILDAIKPCLGHVTHGIFRLGHSVEELRQTAESLNDEYSVQVASTMLRLMTHLQKINHDEFRNMVGLLQMIRNSPQKLSLSVIHEHCLHSASGAFKETLEDLLQLYMLQAEMLGLSRPPDTGLHPFRGDPDLLALRQKLQMVRQEFDMIFADDCLMMVRVVYPHGINIVNPDWNPSYPVSISADRMFALTVSASIPDCPERTPRLLFKPNHRSGLITEITFETPGGHGIRTNFPISLPEGQSLLIGRNLSVPNLFGISRGAALTELSAQGLVENSLWSRGSLLVVRTENELFLFDRGTRNPFAVWSEDILSSFSIVYFPQVLTGAIDKVSYGTHRARYQ